MRKTSDSCMVSAAHPLVTQRPYRLFTFSFRLLGDIREGGVHPRGEVRCVQQWDSSVSQCCRSELETKITLWLVVKINIIAYILFSSFTFPPVLSLNKNLPWGPKDFKWIPPWYLHNIWCGDVVDFKFERLGVFFGMLELLSEGQLLKQN